ncbi:MAG: hypothetical protein HY606_15230 [Planctomycetes bacterium]|nr:hypothetical protein [Planctomycetota bacterium]
MELEYKPDFSIAKKYWDAFWNGGVIDRPVLISTVPKNPENPVSPPPYMSGIDGDFEKTVHLFEQYAKNTYFACEKIPSLSIAFGPDEVSYFIKGAEKRIVVESDTAWIEPFVNTWDNFPVLELDPKDKWYKKLISFYRYTAEKSEGKFLIDMLDFHTHLDALRAIRGTEKLCIDLIDCPDEIEKRLLEIRKIFSQLYMEIYKAGNMEKWGTIGWISFYYKGKFATIQCDFICMVGRDVFRRFVLPAIEEETDFLDHSIFHLDGPAALVHLDDLLSVKRIDAIQWVPGAGSRPHIEWLDVLKKIKGSGKGLIIYPEDADEIKIFHKELGPERIAYQIDFRTMEEMESIRNWLEKNT